MTKRAVSLEAHQISKHYAGHAVVDRADLSLAPGEITALVGRSGSGKTTILRLLAGMERPDSGRVTSGDLVLSTPRSHVPPERRRIGLIFQDFALFPHLNVSRNIMFGLNHIAKDQRDGIVERWLDLLGLTDRKSAFPHQLSGGEQQRVAIARALAADPIAILMDEPFSGLDPVLRNQARTAALSAVRDSGTPALMVTHDAREALEFADRIAVMHDGRILQCDTPDNIYLKPDCLAVAEALGPVQRILRTDLPAEWQNQLPDAPAFHFRPEAIQIDTSGRTTLSVNSARRVGSTLSVHLNSGSAILCTSQILHDLPEIGSTVRVVLNSDCVFTFQARQF